MAVIGVIPARYGSTRFPGKILHPLCGRPLIAWVLDQARKATRLDRVLVATDDERIADAVVSEGGEAVMTRPDHPSGTDRIVEAIDGIEGEAVINIQGDEPLVDPGLIDELAGVLADSDGWDMVTACTPLSDPDMIQSPDVVKVVFGDRNQALYFSRSPIPFVRDRAEAAASLYYRHIGLYGYQRSFLEGLTRQPVSRLEQAEKLEQLRALSMGCRMKVLETVDTGIGVDTPADAAKAEKLLKEAGLA